jgi:hypothetical protein
LKESPGWTVVRAERIMQPPELEIGIDHLCWVVTAYLLASTIVTPLYAGSVRQGP